jgi:hypothetical protein
VWPPRETTRSGGWWGAVTHRAPPERGSVKGARRPPPQSRETRSPTIRVGLFATPTMVESGCGGRALCINE